MGFRNANKAGGNLRSGFAVTARQHPDEASSGVFHVADDHRASPNYNMNITYLLPAK